jgi:hypothetical protein
MNEFGKALDDGKEVRVVFCDVSKAFDQVWHKGLLTKLKSIGIHGPFLSWIENYLLDRKQRVVINVVALTGGMFVRVSLRDQFCLIECFANVAKDYSNFLSVVKCLTEFVHYI